MTVADLIQQLHRSSSDIASKIFNMSVCETHDITKFQGLDNDDFLAGTTLFSKDKCAIRGDAKALLGPLVVPFFAPFNKVCADAWIKAMKQTIEILKASYAKGEQNMMVLVPINSPGGDVSCLHQMLGVIDELRALKLHAFDEESATIESDTAAAENVFAIPEIKSTKSHKAVESSITLVTCGYGMVASCAFVLYQQGDYCLGAPECSYLCHDPVEVGYESGGCARTTLEKAERTTVHLRDLRDEIYNLCEAKILKRFSIRIGKNDFEETKLEEYLEWKQIARDAWYQEKQEYIIDYHSQYGDKSKDLPAYNNNTNILRYIIEDIAKDVHNHWLSSAWMEIFEFSDCCSVHIEETVSRHFQIKRTKDSLRTIVEKFQKFKKSKEIKKD